MAMFKRMTAPLVLVVALACAGPVLAADATVDQVYQAANSGHLDEAQQLMNQVLRDHPNSAKAHYVEAEISARAANFPRALRPEAIIEVTHRPDATVTHTVAEAIEVARTAPKEGIVFFTGSLFVVGEARALLLAYNGRA